MLNRGKRSPMRPLEMLFRGTTTQISLESFTPLESQPELTMIINLLKTSLRMTKACPRSTRASSKTRPPIPINPKKRHQKTNFSKESASTNTRGYQSQSPPATPQTPQPSPRSSEDAEQDCSKKSKNSYVLTKKSSGDTSNSERGPKSSG